MKILLFAPPFELSTQEDYGIYPLALGYLGAVLEKEGHNVKVFDFLYENWTKIKGKVHKIIESEKPDIIGISSMTTNRSSAFEITNLAKKINKNIKVIMGGVHPTIMYKQILENFPVDFIVLGEGEETIVELISAIKIKRPLQEFKKIKGIAFKVEGSIIKTDPRPFIKNLDYIPFPKHEYFEGKIKKFKTGYITSSRGCPIGCTFCSTSCHWGKIRRQRSVKNVIEEIKILKKGFPFIEKIYFQDDEFLMNNEWVKEFCEQLIKEHINIKFECVGRVSSINEEIIIKLKAAGCVRIDFGAESGSQTIINSIGKKISVNQIIRAFDVCKKYNMPAGIYLMVGLPGETAKTINETIKLLKRIRNAELDMPSVFQVYPGTLVYENAKRQGFIDDSYWLTNKIAPFYTLEHSKRRLFLWALKISLSSKFYRGKLFSFLVSKLRHNLSISNLNKQVKKYLS